MNLRTKISRTVFIDMAWVCVGLFSEVTGPTLPALIYRINGDYEEIARALVARSVGFLMGSLAGGIIVERYRRLTDTWMLLSLISGAAAVGAAPWCRTLTLLCISFYTDGVAKGIIAAGGNSFVLRIWRDKVNAPVQSIHLSFGVGALMAAQIVRPFLAERPINYSTEPKLNLSNSTQNQSIHHLGENDAIEYPYIIIASVTLLSAIPFLVMQLFYPVRSENAPCERKRLRCMLNPNSWVIANKSRIVGFFIIGSLCLFSLLVMGAERAMARFIYAFAVKSRLQFSPKAGANLESVFWASFTASRAIMTIIAKCIPAHVLLTTQVVLHVIATMVLAIYGEQLNYVMWICCIVYAMSMSALIPTMMAWANAYIDMAGMMTSFVFIFGAVGSSITSWLAGYFFENWGPMTLMYLLLTLASITTLTFTAMRILARKYGERFGPEEAPMAE